MKRQRDQQRRNKTEIQKSIGRDREPHNSNFPGTSPPPTTPVFLSMIELGTEEVIRQQKGLYQVQEVTTRTSPLTQPVWASPRAVVSSC